MKSLNALVIKFAKESEILYGCNWATPRTIQSNWFVSSFQTLQSADFIQSPFSARSEKGLTIGKSTFQLIV